jgi:hypothetical protein
LTKNENVPSNGSPPSTATENTFSSSICPFASLFPFPFPTRHHHHQCPSLPNIIRQSVSHQQPQQPFILAEGASFFLSRNSIDFFTPKVENRE